MESCDTPSCLFIDCHGRDAMLECGMDDTGFTEIQFME